MLSQYFPFSSLLPKTPADHNRHIWEVPKSEALKKYTFGGNHKAPILIQLPLIYILVQFFFT